MAYRHPLAFLLGPLVPACAADAADATCENTPAAIIWHFQKPPI